MPSLHPTALVAPSCRLADDVTIGPFCQVGPEVELASGVVLDSHVIVHGRTRLGRGCRVHAFAVLGGDPQLRGTVVDGPSELVIGEGVTIREHVTANRGSARGVGQTRIGDHALIMTGSHVGHDCRVGARVVLSNQVHLGGHVVVGDDAVIGGSCAVHQHVSIGCHAMIGGMSGVDADVLPFALAYGARVQLRGVNLRGLRRRGFERRTLRALMTAFEVLFEPGDDNLAERARRLTSLGSEPELAVLRRFLEQRASRPLCRPGPRADGG